MSWKDYDKRKVEGVRTSVDPIVYKKNVIVNLTFESTHCWPECPFDEVDFLRNPHRHIFHITCKKKVAHNDRDVEIIMFKRDILAYLEDRYPLKEGMGRKSCEDLAEELVKEFDMTYCSVLEDGENGAEVWL